MYTYIVIQKPDNLRGKISSSYSLGEDTKVQVYFVNLT